MRLGCLGVWVACTVGSALLEFAPIDRRQVEAKEKRGRGTLKVCGHTRIELGVMRIVSCTFLRIYVSLSHSP
jgi:hypothetical protein